jgi:large subunit ribosomal protein L19e
MSNLKLQKRLASKVLKVGKSRVKLDGAMAEELKEAITRADVEDLVKEGIIEVKKGKSVSRHRARARHSQRLKGRQKGHGRRKGVKTARTPRKRTWINKIRALRKELFALRDAGRLTGDKFVELYRKAKGNFFRSRKHMHLYAEQHGFLKAEASNKEGKK